MTEVVPVDALFLGRSEQGMTDCFDAMPVAREDVLVLFVPECYCRSYLRRRCGCAFTIKSDGRATAKHCPWNVWCVSGKRCGHRALWSKVSLDLPASQAVVGSIVGHDATGSNHAMVTCRINDVTCRYAGKIVTGCGNHTDAVLVRVIDRFIPCARGCSTHAHRHHVTALLDRVSQRLCECAGAE